MKQHFPVMPILKYPLRNTVEIVNFCKSKLKVKHADETHIKSLENLEIPSNLTKGIPPREVFATNFRHGMDEAVNILMELCGNQPALFVIDRNVAYDHCSKCYDK